MTETAEGIGGRKWSGVKHEDQHRFGCEHDGGVLTKLCDFCGEPKPTYTVMEGKTPLADLSEDGSKLVALFIATPQLWDAANEFIQALSRPPKPTLDMSAEQTTAMRRLADMVAKAVGKQDWKDVKQG